MIDLTIKRVLLPVMNETLLLIITRLSLNPTEKLEAEFQSLLAKKRLLLSKQSS